MASIAPYTTPHVFFGRTACIGHKLKVGVVCVLWYRVVTTLYWPRPHSEISPTEPQNKAQQMVHTHDETPFADALRTLRAFSLHRNKRLQFGSQNASPLSSLNLTWIALKVGTDSKTWLFHYVRIIRVPTANNSRHDPPLMSQFSFSDHHNTTSDWQHERQPICQAWTVSHFLVILIAACYCVRISGLQFNSVFNISMALRRTMLVFTYFLWN